MLRLSPREGQSATSGLRHVQLLPTPKLSSSLTGLDQVAISKHRVTRSRTLYCLSRASITQYCNAVKRGNAIMIIFKSKGLKDKEA